MVIRRGYRGAADVALLQGTNVRWIEQVGQGGHLHRGDIPHRLFNGLRLYDPRDLVHIWVDPGGDVAAWGVVYPNHRGFDLQVDPDVRHTNPGIEREALAYLEAELRSQVDDPESGSSDLVVDVFEDDELRARHLEALGWRRGNEPYHLTRRSLDEIPNVVLSPGYVIRAAHGPAEAAALAGVHASSFGSKWTPDMYRKLMGTPGYDPMRELVAIAPDGKFAAFTVMWFDTRNGTGLFEPVGTGSNYRRRGLGTALLAQGMHRMRSAGLHTAMVMYEASNPASGGLYRSVGFEPTWTILDYRKSLEPGETR